MKNVLMSPFAQTLLALGLWGTGIASSLGGNFDLSTDFSPTFNPAGAWSYGYKSTLGGSFSLFQYRKVGYAENGVPVDFWEYQPGMASCIWRNDSSSASMGGGGTELYAPGTVVIHPGQGLSSSTIPEFGVARLTIPIGASGIYTLQTSEHTYLSNPAISGDCDFHVLKNGVSLFDQAMAGGSSTSFAATLTLVAGDTIDFAVGRGADGSGDASGIVISANLVLVPEPGMAALTVVGIGCSLACRRLRRVA
jgi:hypothetical protein